MRREIWGATLHRVLSDQELETVLGAVNIVCMASGVIDDMQVRSPSCCACCCTRKRTRKMHASTSSHVGNM